MGRLKRALQKTSIRRAFVLYTVGALLVAGVLSLGIGWSTEAAKDAIYRKYQPPSGQVVSEGVTLLFGAGGRVLTPEDWRAVSALTGLQNAGVGAAFALSVIGAAALFYRRRLARPIAQLKDASAQIAEGNLDFVLTPVKMDELGELAVSFETMRAALERAERENWRALEDRKQLNGAFSHDLRTPLTVLRGYADMLAAYLPTDRLPREKLLEVTQSMSRQIGRLEQYTAGMNDLQRLEDTPARPQLLDLEEWGREQGDTGSLLCRRREQCWHFSLAAGGRAMLDGALAARVFENLLQNAVSHASRQVWAAVEREGDWLLLQVEDDGPGFSPEALQRAADPFYREEREGHFGLGLSICRALCRNHGGSLSWGNRPAGGARVAARFQLTPLVEEKEETKMGDN